MGWFDEQIRHRIDSDQDVFEESILGLSASVIGRKAAKELSNDRYVARAAIEEIIKYFGYRPESSFNELGEELDITAILRPYGIMHRDVELDEEWYKEAYGPMLAKLKETGAPIALLPKPFKGYTYFDYSTGKEVIVGKWNVEDISSEAFCFYKPLPNKKLDIRDLLMHLWGCIDAGDVAFFLIITALVTFLGYLIPEIVLMLSGFVLDYKNMSMLVATALFLFATVICKFLIGACSEVLMERVEIKTDISVEAAVMNRVMNLPAGFFKDYTAGELSSRISSVGELCELLLQNIISLPVTSLFSLIYLKEISGYSRQLTLPALGIILLTFLFSVISMLIQTSIITKIKQYDAYEGGVSYALINGIQKIRLAGAEKRAFAKWATDYNNSAQLLYNPPVAIKLNGTIHMTIGVLGTIVLYYVAAVSGVSASKYLAFSVAFGFLQGAFSSLSSVALSAAEIAPILKMAEPILKAEPENTEGKSIIKKLVGNIEVSNLHFSYGENLPKILDGISFKIKAGEYVAIVGKTGCGKSTLLRLLLGFETPSKGAVFYDGKDTSRIDMSSLRRKIGTVTQNGALFQGDIYSNIVITDPLLTVEDAWEAAEIAGIAEDIRNMPMGMNTMISEGQGGISGGQKQRLMIARAVAPKPKVLFFDEATSALDNITQKKVSDSLDKLKCTRIVVAHRLSTIKNCDRIIVLDNGKIVEDGKYGELMEKNGFFAELVRRQQV